MTLEFVLVIFIIRHLRKSLEMPKRFPQQDKLFTGIAIFSGIMLGLEIFVDRTNSVLMWVGHLTLWFIVYIVYTKHEFKSARSFIAAVFPYMILSFVSDLVEVLDKKLFDDWDNYVDPGLFFALVWMVAIWIRADKQRKALAKEREKRLREEELNKVIATRKEQLEVMVNERTAELTSQKEELEKALNVLKETQAQLIQSEKMASLGELTAGIAHEIQNPLNFVNNFSEVSAEMLDELTVAIDEGDFAEEVKSIADDIKQNLEKITHHGKRADAIVKGMLLHSRSRNTQKEPTDINALADEYLRLSYHGLRAKDKSFNASMKTDFDESIEKINIVPQDVGRVILNLITNAFYSVTEKKKSAVDGYEPTVFISTKNLGDKVEIKVRDNGMGISQKVMEKIYQPFFTTKPTGQGTGLGLSLSYDIITKGHGGELKVDTKEGEFAEFTILLPVNKVPGNIDTANVS